MELRWLCLSDLHFKFKNFKTVYLRDSLKRYLTNINNKANFILITGDISYKGQKDNEVLSFIQEIAKISQCNIDDVFITPGNHDITRSEDRTVTVKKCIDDSNSSNGMNVKDNRLEHLLIDFFPFKEFSKHFDEKNGLGSCSLTERDKYRILNINSCLFCYGDEDEGELFVCNEKLAQCCSQIDSDDKINIALMHHGIDWLNAHEKRDIQTILDDNNIDIVFTGHNHTIGLETYNESRRKIKQLTCGGIISDNYNEPSFFECIYDDSTKDIKCVLHQYSLTANEWYIAENSLRAFNKGILVEKAERLVKIENTCITGPYDESFFDHSFTKFTYTYLTNYIENNIKLLGGQENIFERGKVFFKNDFKETRYICLADRIIKKFKNYYLFTSISSINLGSEVDIDLVYVWLQLLAYLVDISRSRDIDIWEIEKVDNLNVLKGLDIKIQSKSDVLEMIDMHGVNIYLYFIKMNYNELFSIAIGFIYDIPDVDQSIIIDLKMVNEKVKLLNNEYIGLHEILEFIRGKLVKNKYEYILLYADEGYGKTAFISKLINDMNKEHYPFNIGKNISEYIWLPKFILIDCKHVSDLNQVMNVLFTQAMFVLHKNLYVDTKISDSSNVYLLLEQLGIELGSFTLIIDAVDEFPEIINILPKEILPVGIHILLTSRKNKLLDFVSKENQIKLRGLNKNEIREMFGFDKSFIHEEFIDKVEKQTNGCPLLVREISKEIELNENKIQIINSLEGLFQNKRNKWCKNLVLERILELLIVFEPICNLTLDSIQGYVRYSSGNSEISSLTISQEIETISDQIEMGQQRNYKIRYKAFFDYMMKIGYTYRDKSDIFNRIFDWLRNDSLIDAILIRKLFIYWKDDIEITKMIDIMVLIDLLKKRKESSCLANIVNILIKENKGTSDTFIESILQYLLENDRAVGMGYSYNYLKDKDDEVLKRKAYDFLSALSKEDDRGSLVYASILLSGNEYIDKDVEKGRTMLKDLVDKGQIDACLTLASDLLKENPNESKNIIMKAVQHEDSEAILFYAIQLFTGKYYSLDINESLKWFDKAINLKNTAAMLYLAIEKVKGEKISKDLQGAENLLHNGYELGDYECASLLGRYYLDDLFIGNKYEEGEILLRKAVKYNNKNAMIWLGEKLILGNTINKNILDGVQLFKQVIEIGDDCDKCNIAEILEDYCDENIEFNQILDYGCILEESECTGLQNILAKNLIIDYGSKRNIQKGLQFLNKLIQVNNNKAFCFMGMLQIMGDYVDYNILSGYNNIKKAAELDDEKAINIIKQIEKDEIIIDNNSKFYLEGLMYKINTTSYLNYISNLLDDKKPLRAAELYEAALDYYEFKDIIQNNIAYLIRKENYKVHNPINTFDNLISQPFTNNNSFAVINLFLYKLEKENYIFSEESEIVLLNINTDEDNFEDAIAWWSQLLEIGDPEGALVLISLAYCDRYLFDTNTNLKDLIQWTKKFYNIPSKIEFKLYEANHI